ncbi:hypothetical protein AB0K16_54485 [Nonomuraea jabiensis]|uniref:hypothetical protein n=2 Tax=Nonomuraea TaxID=83681 RepID=UPI00343B27CA
MFAGHLRWQKGAFSRTDRYSPDAGLTNPHWTLGNRSNACASRCYSFSNGKDSMNSSLSVVVGGLVVLAIVCMIAVISIRIAKTAPARLVRALMAASLLLAAIPPILLALYGDG